MGSKCYHTVMKRIRNTIFPALVLLSLAACQFTPGTTGFTPTSPTITATSTEVMVEPTRTITSTATEIPSTTPTSTPVPPVEFAVIGDYGTGDANEQEVAEMVLSWNPDFIITTGDNNYPLGSQETIDAHIGKFYHSYIGNYKGEYGEGSDINRFFPSLGNHDWYTGSANPYLDYFDLPGNERYYKFSWQFIDFFVLDSTWLEPDGILSGSIQEKWLEEQISQSTAVWKIVYFHHAPYTSGYHESSTWMRWPFDEWGIDLVLSGHSHVYERLEVNSLTYIVNGVGGGGVYDFVNILPESIVRYNQNMGAMKMVVTPTQLTGTFITKAGELIDEFTLTHPDQ